MEPTELIFTLLLIVVLLTVAGYFGWGQVKLLRSQGQNLDERRYTVRQAWRRLLCCGLMVVVAGLLVGGFFLDRRLNELRGPVKTLSEEERNQALTEEYKEFARLMAIYWSGALFVVFALLALAAVDVWAIARFGMRQHRQLQATHRADLEEEIARLRQQRNGFE